LLKFKLDKPLVVRIKTEIKANLSHTKKMTKPKKTKPKLNQIEAIQPKNTDQNSKLNKILILDFGKIVGLMMFL